MILYSTSLAESSCGQFGRGSLRSRPQENRFKGRSVEFFNWGGGIAVRIRVPCPWWGGAAHTGSAWSRWTRPPRRRRARSAVSLARGATALRACHDARRPNSPWYKNLHEFGLQVSFTNDWRCVVQQFA